MAQGARIILHFDKNFSRPLWSSLEVLGYSHTDRLCFAKINDENRLSLLQSCQQGLQHTDLLTGALSVYLCCLLQTELGRISNTKASSVVGQWPEIIKQPFFLLNLSSFFFFFSFWFAISSSCRVIYLPAVFNLRKNIHLFKDYLYFIFAVHILSPSKNIRLCLVFMFSCSSFKVKVRLVQTHYACACTHQVTEMSECVFV